MRFEMNIDDRKKLVSRLKELTGLESRYSGVPNCVYYIGDYTVGRDGSVEVDEVSADRTVINTLISEGMLKGELLSGEEEEELQVGENFLKVSYPMHKHTGTSLRNLVYLLYSREPLINKALGTHFEVDKGLIEALKDDLCTVTSLALMRVIADYEAEHGLSMSGIHMTDEEVTLVGFRVNNEAEEADKIKAFTELTELMNKMAIAQKRIQAKTITGGNEKYAMRIWLVHMGMGGNEYKRSRAILLENLSGNCAFRTEEEAEKFRANQKTKREAKKAAE
ncbi:MAG: hypothetical protein LUH18_09280 [Oscillospiraceae bacterium]|nr:hypothetical protein [Oscillospiraceae bacterium]